MHNSNFRKTGYSAQHMIMIEDICLNITTYNGSEISPKTDLHSFNRVQLADTSRIIKNLDWNDDMLKSEAHLVKDITSMDWLYMDIGVMEAFQLLYNNRYKLTKVLISGTMNHKLET